MRWPTIDQIFTFLNHEQECVVNYAIAILVTCAAPCCWLATLLGFPGNWGLVAIAAGLGFFAGPGNFIDVEIYAFLALAALAVGGEIAEFVAGAAGVSQQGGSKTGATLAMLGSIIGAIVGMFVGVPIAIVGSLIAAILFGGAGAFAGAVVGEIWVGREFSDAIRIGWGALFGKLLGTLIKAVCGTVMTILLLIAVWS